MVETWKPSNQSEIYGGRYIQRDQTIETVESFEDGIEVISLGNALAKYDWFRSFHVSTIRDRRKVLLESSLPRQKRHDSCCGSKRRNSFPVSPFLPIESDGLCDHRASGCTFGASSERAADHGEQSHAIRPQYSHRHARIAAHRRVLLSFSSLPLIRRLLSLSLAARRC